MKSINEIKKIAKHLRNLSLTKEGILDVHATKEISQLIQKEQLKRIGMHVENIQSVLLLKEYLKLIQNLVIEDTVIITSAIELDAHEKEHFRKTYSHKSVFFEVNKDILGGLKVQSGWDIIDDTIYNTLHTLPF